MDIRGVGYISARYTKDDYKRLHLTLDSNFMDWEFAIEIFTDRMEERYFNVIEQLKRDYINNGFVIMAIDCMLIDTFVKFIDSSIDNRNNKRNYISFLVNEMSEVFVCEQDARNFYENVRCSILHSTQTSEKYRLAFGTGSVLDFSNTNRMLVDVELFSREVYKFYEGYVQKLRVQENDDIRREFILRMNKLCGISVEIR